MNKNSIPYFRIDYVELYTPMVKPLLYWHTHALGFKIVAFKENDIANGNIVSYLIESGEIRIVLTSEYPTLGGSSSNEISSFINQNYFGVKRIVLAVGSVQEVFENSLANGGRPIKYPHIVKDEFCEIKEASIRLFDNCEVVFTERSAHGTGFRPGYKNAEPVPANGRRLLDSIDHIASEVRINEAGYWTEYLSKSISTELVQSIERSADNITGMVMKISQSNSKNLTFVISEPETYTKKSKVQDNIEKFGAGVHHLAFSTPDIIATTKTMVLNGVEFVKFPASYYKLLRQNPDFDGFDIGEIEKNGILVDKEGDSYLFQKFIKPIGDRPFFLYEIVQRVNGYQGFALKNINVLKRAEESDLLASSIVK